MFQGEFSAVCTHRAGRGRAIPAPNEWLQMEDVTEGIHMT